MISNASSQGTSPMFATLVLAASLFGQTPADTGKLWTGSAYALTTLDTSKPLRFQGGSLDVDLSWEPSKAMFESAPVDVGGRSCRLQFWANPKFQGQTWTLYIQGEPGFPDIDDSDYVFTSASASPLNLSSDTAWHKAGILRRAGVSTYTLTQ
jgi:hypothetical protein